MTHLTRVVRSPHGINILGGLEVIAGFGIFAAAISIEWPVRWASVATLAAAAGLIAAFDFAWRYREVEPKSWRRLISPFTGGCFLFIPLWAWALPTFLFLFATAVSIAARN
jgi:hypothetical protein